MSNDFHFGYEFSPPAERRSIYDARSPLSSLRSTESEPTDSFTASDGAQVPFRVWRAATPRALALLLHGAFDYSGAFDEIGAAFAAQGITAMAIDQRGFGATATRGYWCGENRMIRDVIEAVTFLRARCGDALPVFLLGESMGAAVAVDAAANAPELALAGVVLAAPGAVTGTLLRLFGAFIAPLMRYFTPNSGIVAVRLKAGDLKASAADRLMNDPMVLHRIRPTVLMGMFDLVGAAVDAAPRVHVPVLTMAGTRDNLIGILHIARLHAQLAGEKEWERFENGPHLLLHWRHRDRVLDKVFSWIKAHEIAPGSIPDARSSLISRPDLGTGQSNQQGAVSEIGVDGTKPSRISRQI